MLTFVSFKKYNQENKKTNPRFISIKESIVPNKTIGTINLGGWTLLLTIVGGKLYIQSSEPEYYSKCNPTFSVVFFYCHCA